MAWRDRPPGGLINPSQELFVELLAQRAMEQVGKTKRKTVQHNDIGTGAAPFPLRRRVIYLA